MKKLIRAIKYLQLTQWLPLALESYGVLIFKWWVDSLYSMHNGYQIHTGDLISLLKGYPYSKSSNHKLNMKSSTKDELVVLDDIMTMILWNMYFMESQGYHITEKNLNQDNQSTMLLSSNVKASRGKRTKRINIRYLLVTDQITNKEISVEYCPTDDMLGYFFTKPTQGSLFCKFRKLILNLWTDDLYRYYPKYHRSLLYQQILCMNDLHMEVCPIQNLVSGQT